MAITVPRFGPELINWALSDEYHNVPGGHIRIYRRSVLAERLDLDRPRRDRAPLRPRPAQPLLVAQVLVGTTNDEHPLVKRYHQLLVWDIMKRPRPTRYAEAVLSPVMGKSLVVYLRKPQ